MSLKIKSAVFGFTSEDYELNDEIVKNISAYVNEGMSGGSIVKFGGNLFDMASLSEPCCLDCMLCDKVRDTHCCAYRGYAPDEEDSEKVFSKFHEILQEALPADEYAKRIEHIERYGLFCYDYDFLNPVEVEGYKSPAFRPYNGDCIFLAPMDKADPKGCKGCAIHSYALRHRIPVHEFKPKSCMMYPLEVMRLNGKFDFIYGTSRRTTGFSRFFYGGGEQLCDNDPCITPDKKWEEKCNGFKLENYVPIFRSESKLLELLYGDKVNEFLESAYSEYSNGNAQ